MHSRPEGFVGIRGHLARLKVPTSPPPLSALRLPGTPQTCKHFLSQPCGSLCSCVGGTWGRLGSHCVFFASTLKNGRLAGQRMERMFVFLAGPVPLRGHRGPLPAECSRALWPPVSAPTGDLFARIFSPPLLFHNGSDPVCCYFSRLIEYVLRERAVEARRRRQAQQARHDGGLGGPFHLGDPGPAEAGAGGHLPFTGGGEGGTRNVG